MITNYIPNACKYSVNNLKKVVHIFSESENVIHIDNGEAYVTSGITDFQTIYATSVDFAESTSYDDRFKFEKQITVTVDGFLKLDSLNEKYYLVLEDENHTMWLVNADFPSFVTYTYTLSEGVDETVFTFNVLSNFPTLKLNATINNSYECKDYSLANVKKLKMNLKENCTIDHVNHIIYDSSNTPYYIVKFNEGTLKMEETYDGFNVTTTIQFNINFDDYKASWHYNLLEYQDNKYVAVTDHLAAGFEMGLIPSYNVQGSSQKGQGDIVTIRLVGTSQRGSEWAEKWTEATLIPDYVWLLSEEWTCYTPPTPPPPPPPAFEGKYKLTLNNSNIVTAACDASSSITRNNVSGYSNTTKIVEIGDCVTVINTQAFVGFNNLTAVYISNSVSTIRRSAFDGCSGLTSCTIGSGVTEIGYYAFRNCSGLTSIDIPDSVTSIGNEAFVYCTSLTSCTIGSGITSIPNSLFDACNSITSVGPVGSGASIEIPDSVTSIGYASFGDCASLTAVTLTNNLTSIDRTAFANNNIRYFYVDTDAATTNEMFKENTSIQTIVMGNNVTTIEDYAFRYCNGLTSVTIGNSVTSIGVQAFYGCTSLVSVTIYATTPPTLGYDVFYATNDCVIYVPAESLETYKSASVWWSSYASRLRAIPT